MRRRFLALSDKIFISRRGRIDFVELGGPHLEFPGHLADGKRPAAVHCQPVLAQRALGETGSLFWLNRTGSVPSPRNLRSITSWPIPPTAPKIRHHPEVIAQGHNSTALPKCQAARLLIDPCNSETCPQDFKPETTVSLTENYLSTSFYFLLELNVYNYFIYFFGVINAHGPKFPQ